ncbi:hypothetical protein ACFE04_022024 [Oxalis oulophora]
MKFMKLGSRPDTFHTVEAVRSVSSEVSSDLIIQVNGSSRYLLHKFPLLSKCARLQKLCTESESSPHQLIQLPNFPGGIESFELCAKFCYGITITLSAHNIIAARCAAEYLQMTEDVEKGNLIYKLEVFFNSCILRGWKDCIITLQSTKGYPLLSEDLGITCRCIEAISSKVLTNPSKVSLSHSYSRHGRDNLSSCNGDIQSVRGTNKGWWAEDLAELCIDLYWRTMIAIKSAGKVPANVIGDALKIYASRWLPNKSINRCLNLDSDSDSATDQNSKHRLLLESIISLVPAEKGSVSCSFLLKLLKATNILNASSSSKMELARRIALQLEEATVNDLLIPSLSHSNDSFYDVDIIIIILEQFMLLGQSPPTSPPRFKLEFERRRSRSAENIDFEFQESRRSSSASHSVKLKVAKLVDGYLQEIARDVHLPLSKFIAVAESIQDFSRLDHDDLYRAIDIYLKQSSLRSPLSFGLLYVFLSWFQKRPKPHGAKHGKITELPSNLKALLAAQGIDRLKHTGPLSSSTTVPADDQWSVSGALKSPKSKISTLRMKLAEDDELEDSDGIIGRNSNKFKAFCALPTRPKRMFSKLLSINRSGSEKN